MFIDILTAIVIGIIILYIAKKNSETKVDNTGVADLDIPEPEVEDYDREFYIAHISSEKFKTLKQIRLAMDNFKCQQCGVPVTMQTSHCHHVNYKRLGFEKYSDVITVCPGCHHEIHEFHGKNAKLYPILK